MRDPTVKVEIGLVERGPDLGPDLIGVHRGGPDDLSSSERFEVLCEQTEYEDDWQCPQRYEHV